MSAGTRFALSIGLGPVGSFISAGRRSRDLWWGSTWLAECTAAVATTLHECGAKHGFDITLLLPSQARLEKLRNEEDAAGHSLRAFHGRVSNHVRAIAQRLDDGRSTPPTEDILDLVIEVEARAHEWLRDKLKACLASAESRIFKDRTIRRLDISSILDRGRFESQLDAIANGDFVHLAAGWTLLADEGGGPGPALHRADELMMAARRTRPFHPPSWSTAGTRKSDLDAGRDGVLREQLEASERASARRVRATLGIGESEQLDALGFARRIAAFEFEKRDPQLGRLPFPPISRIAVNPWIHRANTDERTRHILEQLKQQLERSLPRDREAFLAWCTPACDPERHHEDDLPKHLFPFDASILLEGGVSTALERVRRMGVDEARPMIQGIQGHVEELHRILGVPAPYYALVEADGDGVGSALERADTNHDDGRRDRYQHIVQCLDAYADRLDSRLRPEYGARAFYVGGDDALVLVPLDHLTAVLRAMSTLFSESLDGDPEFTLTFGVAIAHVKDDLRWVRRQASEAIGSAKRKRRRDQRVQGAQWIPVGWAEIREQPRSGALRTCSGPVPALLQSIDDLVMAVSSDALSQRSPQLMLDLGTLVDIEGSGEPTEAAIIETLGMAATELACERALAQLGRSTKKVAKDAIEAALGKVPLEPWEQVVDLASRMRLAARLASSKGDR